jgi:hypothetical protein
VHNLDHNEESKNQIELQQSLNYDDNDKLNIKVDQNEDLCRNETPISFEKRTPRLLNNIVVNKNAKSSSVEKISSKKLSPEIDKREFVLNASNSNKISSLAVFNSSDPPLNLMQFRGVRVKPDKKVLDILAILNNYRRQCEQTGMHLEAKKARKRYSELKIKEELRHEHNLEVVHEQEMDTFGKLNYYILYRATTKRKIHEF